MILAADAHIDPDHLPDEVKDLIAEAHLTDQTIVFLGDTFNILPYGLDAYRNCPAMLSFLRCLLMRNVILIPGNHDPEEKLREMFQGCKNVKIVSEKGINTETYNDKAQTPYLFTYIYATHGHTWGPLWSWLGPIATPLNRFANRYFLVLWYKFADKMGWMPSHVEEEGRYHAVVLSLLMKGARYSNKHGCTVVMGHSHKEYTLIGHKKPHCVISLPPLVTRKYLSVTDKMQMKEV